MVCHSYSKWRTGGGISMSRYLMFGSSVKARNSVLRHFDISFNIVFAAFSYIGNFFSALKNSISPRLSRGNLTNMADGSANVGKVAIEVAVSEVILFALLQVINNAITNANLTGVLKGSNGALAILAITFYVLGAALVPLALLKHAGFF